jgi:ABC-type multidrug transport system fused ATPase/permease subunit
MSLELIISALLWMTFAVIVSQATSILLMWWLGLPPGKLSEEIAEVQNPAVGACFFIVSLAASIFISIMASAGFSPDPSFIEGAFWIIGGLVVAAAYTAILFSIAYRFMRPKKGESLYHYMRREIIDEQNVALAFFLGGLSITPFVAVVFQLI